jgi:hypothetical protein
LNGRILLRCVRYVEGEVVRYMMGGESGQGFIERFEHRSRSWRGTDKWVCIAQALSHLQVLFQTTQCI